ncbi:MAG: Holliday junction resolvase RuvX [Thermacetogeniaceae bacterium]
MRIIGLDLGKKRIGVAISDELGFTAQALTTLQRGSFADDCAALRELVQSYGVEEIVVGLPLDISGQLGQAGEECQAYGKRLAKNLGVTVVFWDERLSTVAAEKSLLEGGMRRNRRRRVIDQVAACWILGGYLNRWQGKL